MTFEIVLPSNIVNSDKEEEKEGSLNREEAIRMKNDAIKLADKLLDYNRRRIKG